MDNLTDLWKELNTIIELYVEEDLPYNVALERIENINKNNTLGVKIDAYKMLLNKEDYNEDRIISYEDSYEDYYDYDDNDY